MISSTLESAPTHQLVSGLAKIGLVLRHEAWRDRGRSGLTPTQASILALAHRRGGRGSTLGELAEELGVTAATASDSVSALAAKGLVVKERSTKDGRSLALLLTPSGTQEARRTAEWPDAVLAAVAALSGEEQAVCLRVLTKMIRELQEHGRIPVARMCVSCRFFRPHVHDDRARPHHCAFVDTAFGEGELRLECADHEPASLTEATTAWDTFLVGATASAHPRKEHT